MKRVRFHEAARDELIHEVLYYKSISAALGERFMAAVEQAVQLAAEFPAMGSPYRHGTRRCFPRKFPFSVVYVEREDEIHVLALAPDSRKPGYWRARRNDG
ncbi:type II toxin-antitoxin system RelE/ParE family toxin [Roseateles saccharophilus]|uniref:ParE-like toxin of type II ParDE toxin-antitoxin system n=1 Tax=Roseateles saccharophilus TaxID=304 RepID=A0A4R3VED8_ROSSA|nr:type II toxin-antitoxin system RelE/ParE family toxin [Roseateles saccharophilus]MDG0832990.1 type II toxin-antitoxin system RelE/ParE family toxin [Roseateles saccharophilus]TCV02082.1 ParE-like toxin of type II ParDE toxin-antitoxin system [Roseateles saccharophilus]